jgi:uncharacterized protein YdhG (YjbR/CyaY superfamily)
MKKAKSVEYYINDSPPEAQKHLRELRALLKKVAPKATEAIKWRTPVFEEGRILFSFSAFKTYITFMPTRTTLNKFKSEVKGYKTGKDTIQFPHDKPLPTALIKKMAAYRVKEVKAGALWMHNK